MFLHEHEEQVRRAERQLEIELELLWERFPHYPYPGREYGHHRRQRVKQVLIFTLNNQNYIIMDLQIAILDHTVLCRITDFDSEDVLFRKFLGFRYVHQIQNLYYALTGEELTIKELA